jgi:hypothetical protein
MLTSAFRDCWNIPIKAGDVEVTPSGKAGPEADSIGRIAEARTGEAGARLGIRWKVGPWDAILTADKV